MTRMPCKECRRWWSPYLDSELDASTTFEVSEHLRTCHACRERFEREEFVENWLRDRLRREQMPAGLWLDLCRHIRGGQLGMRAPARRVLAVAASIFMLLSAAVLVYLQVRPGDAGVTTIGGSGPATAIQVGQSVSDILQDRRPTLVAFSDRPEAKFHQELEALSRKCLDAVVHIDPTHGDGHSIELIRVSEQHDDSGEPYLEVHLNCCGRPMLIALARSGCGTCIEELQKATGNCKKKSRRGCPKSPPIEAQSVERDGIMIAAATADHYLTGVLSAISVTPSGG
jgi:hypothetical protein